jgi:hypothetical protein
MEFPQGESMGSIYLSNLDVALSNLGGPRGPRGPRWEPSGPWGPPVREAPVLGKTLGRGHLVS